MNTLIVHLPDQASEDALRAFLRTIPEAEVEEPDQDGELSPEWLAEIRRRSQELQTDRSGRDAFEYLKSLQARHAKAHDQA